MPEYHQVQEPSYLEEKIWKLRVLLLGEEGYRFLPLFAKALKVLPRIRCCEGVNVSVGSTPAF